jgi:flagellar hook protein FlgE
MSFNIALTGLNAVNDQLDAVSNNIANAATTGFKSSRADFGSVYSQSQAMGVETLGLTQSISQGGSLTSTGRTLDLAISGGGFFLARGSNGSTQYTRAGVFGTDTNNFLVNASNQKLQGYGVDANNNLQVGTVGDLQLQTANLPARATDALSFVANLDANQSPPAIGVFDADDVATYNSTYTSKVFDSLGKEHTLTQYFVKTDDAAGTWDVHYFVDGNPVVDGTGVPQVQELDFSTSGALELTANPQLSVNIAGAATLNVAIDYTGTSQYGSDFVVTTNKASGYSAGEQTGISVEKDGKVFANYSNGQRMLQGQVVLATFINAEGLKNENGTQWSETSESGAPLIGIPGVGAFGAIASGALESSNVDLTQQLVELMTGQRNYQANTKVISADKEMTQVLFNAI